MLHTGKKNDAFITSFQQSRGLYGKLFITLCVLKNFQLLGLYENE